METLAIILLILSSIIIVGLLGWVFAESIKAGKNKENEDEA